MEYEGQDDDSFLAAQQRKRGTSILKRNEKRIVSGLLSAVTVLSFFLQSFAVFAAEAESAGYEAEYPSIEQVRERLNEDEIVTAEDYEIEAGSDMDVEHDFTGIKYSPDKVRVTFHHAGNHTGKEFDSSLADTYRAVYFVEPVSKNPSYYISRNIIVKEKESAVGDDEPEEEYSPETDEIPIATMPEAEMEAAMEEMEQAESTGQDAEMIAEEEGLLLFAESRRMARSSESATMERGRRIYYPGNLGRFFTCYFTVNGRIAYCLESAKNAPDTGEYASQILEDNPSLQKVLYYGFGGAGDVTDSYMPAFDEDMRYVFTHIAASYFYCGMDGFAGCTIEDLESCGVLGWIDYLDGLPAPPDPYLSLSETSLTAVYSDSGQITGETRLDGDSRNYITIALPEEVTFHNSGDGSTQTGGDVCVYGGTSFYFSAPATVHGDWSTGDMKGSIGSVWRAIVVSTGSSKQDIGSYYEEEYGNTVSLHVDWMNYAKVKVIKVDSVSQAKLSGVIFGLYRDEACTELIVEMPATDQNGVSEVEIAMTQDTVYLKEIAAPAGYRYNATSYGVVLKQGETASTVVPDEEQLGNLTIYKEGEVLTGASLRENGAVFQYENRRQRGAVFRVYAAKDITTPYGLVVHKAGELVAENLVTGADGSVTLKNLHLGTYRVAEVRAPKNFYNKGETKEVEIAYAGQMAEAAFSDTTFQNDRQKARVSVVKRDKDTSNGLEGGIFGLYVSENITTADGNVIVAKGTLLDRVTTDGNGNATFSVDIPIGFGYEVKEVRAPENYLRNQKEVYAFRFDYTNDREARISFSHIFTNERVRATIRIFKKDKETGVNRPQGDAVLSHAVYKLYARKDIIHPDKKTGVLYHAGEAVGTLTTDKDGKAEITGLYLGEYYVKEMTPPAGYLTDEAEYDLVCNYEDDLTATVERECISPEQVKKQPFQIIKAADNGKTDADLLAGAGFTAYLVSSLNKKQSGAYDFDSAKPVVIGENGATEIFTDERGYACSIPLPFGTYLVRETTTPHNYTPVKDFIVRITEHKLDTPQVWRVLLDDEFEAKLKIVKQDDETRKPVLAENTEFKVYDLDEEKYVEQVTTYPTVITHKSYFTDGQGYLILPQNLKIGHYRIEEASAPFGYTLNENYYEVSVDSNTMYQIDEVSANVVIDVVYENHPVKGELNIIKKGEVLSGYKKEFIYETECLAGAEFGVYAEEDIYTADFQKDGDGKRILEYASGTLVETLVTDEDGKAFLGNLPLGTYRVVETKAPEGYVRNEAPQIITFDYADQDTPVIEQTAIFENERQKVEIAAVKKDADNGAVLEGAVFGLYTKTDIIAKEEVIVKADTLLEEAVTQEDGRAVFETDVPFGEYYIREQKAPEGYVSCDDAMEAAASYQGQDVKAAEFTSEFENKPTKISVKKTDLTTGVELEGATLTVFDRKGNVVDTWKSVKGREHMIERLTVGETYTLREELAPYGYLQAEEITFTVEDTAEVQKVEMKDDVPKGMILINKKGEFLEKVSFLESVGGLFTHMFEYITGSLQNVTFEVYALEDIQAADKESADYYKKDELVGTITTSLTGYAKLENLPLGKYYVKEKETAEGYVLDEEIREVDLSYRDQDTKIITYSTDWQNYRKKTQVHVLKTEKDSDRGVEGTIFALCAKEDIINSDGKVILEADTIIEEKATNADGQVIFSVNLPVGFPYYVKETAPASGFTSEGEVQAFDFTYEDSENDDSFMELNFENVPTVFEFSKVTLTGGQEIEGARLEVRDESGNLVDEWVSGKEPHMIKELVVGKKYTMTELQPAEGYVTAERIEFTVENTDKTQKVEMRDDVSKVEISKTDIAGEELPGAKLTIFDKDGTQVASWISEDKPYYMEMLPIGEYTLHEEIAPDGYLVAEDVTFEVRDTPEIQKVVMKDEAKPDEPSETPKTGDDRTVWIWIVLAALAICGVGYSLSVLRKR